MNEVERGGGVGGDAGESQSFPQSFSQAGQNGGQFGQNVPQGMSFSQGAVSSGGGDIILNSGADSGGKSRKWIVVVLIVVVVLVALVGGGVALWESGVLGGETSESVSASDTYVAITEYTKYLLYGDVNAKNDVLTEPFDLTSTYAVDKALESEDNAFFGNLEKYWSRYIDIVNNNEKLLNDMSLMGDTEAQSEYMDFVVNYFNIQRMSEGGILALYLNNGKDGAYSAIESRYKKLLDNSYARTGDYVDAEIKLAKTMVDFVDFYNEAGCVIEGVLNEDCMEEKDIPTDLASDYIEQRNNENLYVAEDVVMMLKENSYRLVEEVKEVVNEN